MIKVCTVKTKDDVVVVSKATDSHGMPIKRRVSSYILKDLYRTEDNGMKFYLGLNEKLAKEISETIAMKLVKETLDYLGKRNDRNSCYKYLTQNINGKNR